MNPLELKMALKGLRRALDTVDTAMESDLQVKLAALRQQQLRERIAQVIANLNLVEFATDDKARDALYYVDPNNDQTFLPTVSAIIHFLKKDL